MRDSIMKLLAKDLENIWAKQIMDRPNWDEWSENYIDRETNNFPRLNQN